MKRKETEFLDRLTPQQRAAREARILAHMKRDHEHQAMVARLMARPPKPPALPRGWSHRRAVIEVDSDGNERRFELVKDAAQAFGLSSTAVTEAIRQHYWSAKANRWWYHADRPRPNPPAVKKLQAIVVNGRQYDSIKQAAQVTHRGRRGIEYAMRTGRIQRIGKCAKLVYQEAA